MTKFNLSIDLFTQDVRDAADVAKALRQVADRLAKVTSLPWSPYALTGEIYAEDSKRCIGTWSVDPERDASLVVASKPQVTTATTLVSDCYRTQFGCPCGTRALREDCDIAANEVYGCASVRTALKKGTVRVAEA